MDFLITLPPDVIRNKIIDAFVTDFVKGDHHFHSCRKLINELLAEGYSRNGITCLFLHESTQKFIKNKIVLKKDSTFLQAALANPICLN
jgi:hypothetical protein